MMTRTLFVLMSLVLSGCSVNEIVTAEETELVDHHLNQLSALLK